MKKQCEKCVATLEKLLAEIERKDKYITYLRVKLDQTGAPYKLPFKENNNAK